jgi:hypothetical protein
MDTCALRIIPLMRKLFLYSADTFLTSTQIICHLLQETPSSIAISYVIVLLSLRIVSQMIVTDCSVYMLMDNSNVHYL